MAGEVARWGLFSRKPAGPVPPPPPPPPPEPPKHVHDYKRTGGTTTAGGVIVTWYRCECGATTETRTPLMFP